MRKLISKVLLLDLLQGLWVTFRNQHPKNIYTEQYPAVRPKISDRYRGAPRLHIDPETGQTKCNACGVCQLSCPEKLIKVTSVRDEATKKKVLVEFEYDTSRCMFCGICEDVCVSKAIDLTQDFELASYSREGQLWDRKKLEEGPKPTQYKF